MIALGTALRECLKDFFGSFKMGLRFHRPAADDLRSHLDAAIDWLKAAAAHGQGGVSSHYHLLKGKWTDPFPETTGYIIPTLYDYARLTGDRSSAELAERLTEWLVSVQLPDGACVQGTWNPARRPFKPIVFNTGQNIFGFLKAWRETGREGFLDAACRAGDFLAKATDEQRVWNRALHHSIPHTYNSRTAWALLLLNEVVPDERYVRTARANLEWIVHQQQRNGWFAHANFKPGELPNTHGIAYTLRGLLESHLITGERRYLNAVLCTLDRFHRLLHTEKRMIYTFWDSEWRNHGKYLPWLRGRYVCLTGLAQLAGVWLRLFTFTQDAGHRTNAESLLDFVLSTQNLISRNPGISGGIKGSFPIYGSYSVMKFPNWAAKFTADAVMQFIEIRKNENS